MDNKNTNHFEWKDEYKIGNSIVDLQHQHLFDLANQIIESCNDKHAIHLKVLALYDYTKVHFRDEEYLMACHNYPDYSVHKESHKKLTMRLYDISSGIVIGDTNKNDVVEFVNNWVLKHIIEEDLRIGKFLNAESTEHHQPNKPI